jgi:hypothetical protein
MSEKKVGFEVVPQKLGDVTFLNSLVGGIRKVIDREKRKGENPKLLTVQVVGAENFFVVDMNIAYKDSIMISTTLMNLYLDKEECVKALIDKLKCEFPLVDMSYMKQRMITVYVFDLEDPPIFNAVGHGHFPPGTKLVR